ncbi:MAG: type I polyketide synthase, partial [Cyclobacteriaceae bacterium]
MSLRNENQTHDIAIVGMSCRFPGAPNISEYLNLLQTGQETITQLSNEALASALIPESIYRDPNYVPYRGILNDIELFDSGFFKLTPQQAALLDPQHRVWLECVYLALEDANVVATDQEVVGVYTGCRESTYLLQNICQSREDINRLLNLAGADSYQWFTSNDKDSLATRTSFLLNLTGPSITVQTACSTSLVAVAEACRSLRQFQCDVCIAGGVTVTFPQARGHLYQEGSIYSIDGKCRAFDAAASGTVFGDGAGAIVLKRVEDAIEQRDNIHAIIKGWAINNDGGDKASFSAPSPTGQAEVIALAQALAQIDPRSIGYVETHGTGTLVGDPIEVEGLKRAFGLGTKDKMFCGIGSVKTNIGHLDAAAGVAGLIKTVLSIKHHQLFPSANFKKPNPSIDFEDSPFYVVDRLKAWDSSIYPRRAGVTSLGVGGTNCHVILEEAPEMLANQVNDQSTIRFLPLSAKDDLTLQNLVRSYTPWLGEVQEPLSNICYTASVGRNHYPFRTYFTPHGIDDLSTSINEYKRPTTSPAKVHEDPVVTFLFSGQGSQRINMGIALMDLLPSFKKIMTCCDEILDEFLEHSILEVISNPILAKEYLNRTDYTQPALFVVEYSLATLWQSWGLRPSYLLGHSLGEYVAACVAGVFSLEDGLRLVATRGKLIQELTEVGSMAAVFSKGEEVKKALKSHKHEVSIAAINGPEHHVISGNAIVVKKILRGLEDSEIYTKELSVSRGFHSPLIESIIPEFSKALEQVTWNLPTIPIVSTLSGDLIGDSIAEPQYWIDQLCQPVNY